MLFGNDFSMRQKKIHSWHHCPSLNVCQVRRNGEIANPCREIHRHAQVSRLNVTTELVVWRNSCKQSFGRFDSGERSVVRSTARTNADRPWHSFMLFSYQLSYMLRRYWIRAAGSRSSVKFEGSHRRPNGPGIVYTGAEKWSQLKLERFHSNLYNLKWQINFFRRFCVNDGTIVFHKTKRTLLNFKSFNCFISIHILI